MRNPDRIDKILNQIKTFWKAHPDLRLAQLISNANHTHRARQGLSLNNDVFNLEDDDLSAILQDEIWKI